MHRLGSPSAVYFSGSRFVLYLKIEAHIINLQGTVKTQRRNLSTCESLLSRAKIIALNSFLTMSLSVLPINETN